MAYPDRNRRLRTRRRTEHQQTPRRQREAQIAFSIRHRGRVHVGSPSRATVARTTLCPMNGAKVEAAQRSAWDSRRFRSDAACANNRTRTVLYQHVSCSRTRASRTPRPTRLAAGRRVRWLPGVPRRFVVSLRLDPRFRGRFRGDDTRRLVGSCFEASPMQALAYMGNPAFVKARGLYVRMPLVARRP